MMIGKRNVTTAGVLALLLACGDAGTTKPDASAGHSGQHRPAVQDGDADASANAADFGQIGDLDNHPMDGGRSNGNGDLQDSAAGDSAMLGAHDAASDAQRDASHTADAGATSALVLYGDFYQGGQFHLGPVDWEQTTWPNACAPATKYAPAVRQAEGLLLAGLPSDLPNVGAYCDACIYVQTAKGKSATLRVVTYGVTTQNRIDTSQQAFDLLNSGEYPRSMKWAFAKCPDTGPIMYEMQAKSSEWWTSFWVRNARVPITKVEVKSKNHAQFTELQRGGDGTLTDDAGFGQGTFTIRLTGMDGSTLQHTFAWPAAGVGGQILTAPNNFP